MPELDLNKIHLDWCEDILKRIQIVLDDPSRPDREKIESTRWLVKQALKIDHGD
jgi:hypothetical protein